MSTITRYNKKARESIGLSGEKHNAEKALVMSNIKNDITKNYKDVIGNITCYNLRKANYGVNVLSDCITCYGKRKIDEMRYYKSKGSKIISLNELLPNHIFEAQKN